MPTRLCSDCNQPAVSRGRCDKHNRSIERNRSRDRRGSTNSYETTIAERDADPNYRYPRRNPQ